jgi:hypothetical protein
MRPGPFSGRTAEPIGQQSSHLGHDIRPVMLLCSGEDKVLSLFEPHTEVIRKGKAHKPNEFGRLVRIDEVENGIVSG